MGTEENLNTEFRIHASPVYNELYKRTAPCHLSENQSWFNIAEICVNYAFNVCFKRTKDTELQ